VESPACRTYCVRRVTCIGSCWYTLETRKSRRVGVLLRCRPAAAAVERPARRGAGANNYLGLSNHPRLREAAHRALDEHGFGLSSVRFICGTQDAHRRLEAQLADFHHQQAAILYPSCFDANAGLFEARPCLGRPAWVALPVPHTEPQGGRCAGGPATDSVRPRCVVPASCAWPGEVSGLGQWPLTARRLCLWPVHPRVQSLLWSDLVSRLMQCMSCKPSAPAPVLALRKPGNYREVIPCRKCH
jgi:hypothetical protein